MANSHHSKEKYIQIANKLRGQKRTQEQKDNISKALMGHKHSPETLAKLRGRKVSEEGKLRMSNAMKGRIPWNKGKTGIYSKETIEKLRKANLGKQTSYETKKKLRDATINYHKSRNPNYVPREYEKGEIFRRAAKVRKDRINKNGGYHSKRQWELLKAAFNYKCNICHRQEPEIKLTKDHIISLKNGGTNDIGNIQPLCMLCNSRKG